jgi:hypothetical protein
MLHRVSLKHCTANIEWTHADCQGFELGTMVNANQSIEFCKHFNLARNGAKFIRLEMLIMASALRSSGLWSIDGGKQSE